MKVSVEKGEQRGSSIIEGALVLVVFTALLVGIADFGQMLYLHTTLMERTRNAARLAAVRGYSADAVKNLIAYDSAAAPPLERGALPPGFFGLTPEHVSVQEDGGDTADARLTVTVTNLTYRTYSPFFAGARKNAPVRVTVPVEGR